MYCPNCGTQLPDDSKFCTNCGARFGQGAQAPSAPPQYPYAAPQPYVALPLKSEILALILAFFIPGAGHIYAGKIARGVVILVIYFSLTVLSTLWVFTLIPGFATDDPMAVMDALGGSLALIVILSLVTFIIWIAQLIDAYNQVKTYNDALRQTGQAPW